MGGCDAFRIQNCSCEMKCLLVGGEVGEVSIINSKCSKWLKFSSEIHSEQLQRVSLSQVEKSNCSQCLL